jgi:uncharacterized membrane protein
MSEVHPSADARPGPGPHTGGVTHLWPPHVPDKLWRTFAISHGLFCALFIGSVVFGLADLNASYAEFVHLGFSSWAFHVLTIAKVLGVVAIMSNRSRTLKDFAFAGFLFDLSLALIGHLVVPEPKAILPAVCLGLWAWTFRTNRKMYP